MVQPNLPIDPQGNDPVMRLQLDKFLQDKSAVGAFAGTDRAKMSESGITCLSTLTTHYNFETFKTSLQAAKAKNATLPSGSEAMYVQRAQQRLDGFMSFASAAGDIQNTLAASGADHAFELHKRALFWNTQRPPYVGQLTQHLIGAGMPASDIVHCQAWLKTNNWDALSYPGIGGTISGVATAAQDQIASMQNELAAVKAHGLSTIEGASGNHNTDKVIGVLVTIVIVVAFCIVTVAVLGSPIPCIWSWSVA